MERNPTNAPAKLSERSIMKTQKVYKLLPLAGAIVLALTGCASSTDTSGTDSSRLSQLEAENESLKQQLGNEASLNASREDNINAASSNGELLPPGAEAGECYARIWVPTTYRDVEREVLVKEADERVEIIPAVEECGTEEVVVKEASTRIETVPAVYGTETETVMVKEAERVWLTDRPKDSPPASPELLNTANIHGISLDAATPGMCFHEHYRPAKYTTEDQKVLVSEADSALAVSSAEYRWTDNRVLVKEASYRMEEVPAVYDWEEEKIVDTPAHTIWKQGTGPIQKIDEATGEIMCLVEIPATYKTIRKRVIKSPATTKRIEIPAEYETIRVKELVTDASSSSDEIPAEYKTVAVTKLVSGPEFVWHEIHNLEEPSTTRTGNKICLVENSAKYETVTRKVVKTAATTRNIEIPQESKTVEVCKVASPAKENRIAIPAEYETVTEKHLDKEGFMDWRSILCQTNMTNTRISEIQTALKNAGYDPGPMDGDIGQETMNAVNAFQRDNGLPVDRYLNVQTVEALGVSTR